MTNPNPTNPIPQRLQALRAAMREHGLTHYLVPSADEHVNEYLPLWRARREFASGFTGSAGDALVGLEDAWLFTDGRYHLQAERELAGSTYELSKVGAAGHDSLAERLRVLPAGARVGVDPMVLPIATAQAYRAVLGRVGGELVGVRGNLIDPLWSDRPAPATSELVPVDLAWVGRSCAEKLAALREDLAAAGADATVVVKLDQIAWLTNLRSRDDVPFNPVFEAYAFVDGEALHLFLHGGERRLPAAARRDLPGLAVHEHGDFLTFLTALDRERRVLLDPSGTTLGVQEALAANPRVALVEARSPIEDAKARKNEVEQESMRRANRRASGAKARALAWLRAELAAGRRVTERRFRERIEELYEGLEDFWGLSFNTISATGANGAVMHYGEAADVPLEPGQLFLIDSGSQVGGGTTDDTRTVAVGEPTAEQRRLYTLVLKSHVASASAVFPSGVPGTALDSITRGPLWREGLNFDHGTGHGVGCFLNVHEGPFALAERERKPFATNPLLPGMVTSIEPGYYRPGWGGIRLENLYLVVEDHVDDTGKAWLRFEPLTFIPFDRRLIDDELLDERERDWLEGYERRCREELAKELEPAEVAGL